MENILPEQDVIMGAVLIPGASAPKLLSERHMDKMKKGTTIIDISIDQGGITEFSRPTSIENPTFIYNKRKSVFKCPEYLSR